MTLSFEKWHGLGNDFVVVKADAWRSAGGGSELARKLCALHFGVGADGVLITDTDAAGRITMLVLNADGTRPEMCGNGLRCVAAAHGQGTIEVATDAGVYRCQVRGDQVEVPMGGVAFPSHTPIHLNLPEEALTLYPASTGNPHAVMVLEPGADTIAQAKRLGPVLTSHPVFPDGANVEFAAVVSRRSVHLTVWERGAGLTLACGTGACATVAILVRLGHLDADADIAVQLPGGTLSVRAGTDGSTTMRGPARLVFRGAFVL